MGTPVAEAAIAVRILHPVLLEEQSRCIRAFRRCGGQVVAAQRAEPPTSPRACDPVEDWRAQPGAQQLREREQTMLDQVARDGGRMTSPRAVRRPRCMDNVTSPVFPGHP